MKRDSLNSWDNKYPSIKAFVQDNLTLINQEPDWWKDIFDDLEDLRKIGHNLIKSRNLEIINPTPNQAHNLWIDFHQHYDPPPGEDLDTSVKTFLETHRETLQELYTFHIANTINYWYETWIELYIRNDCPIEEEDYQIYFTLLQPTHPKYPLKPKGPFAPKINKYLLFTKWFRKIQQDNKIQLERICKEVLKYKNQGYTIRNNKGEPIKLD